MLSRERVETVIRHGTPDRVPIYAWVRANLNDPIAARFGSVEAFEDVCEFDFAHLFGGPGRFAQPVLAELRRTHGAIEPRHILEAPESDPDNTDAYADIVAGVRHHKERRGRFVYVQTPGIFEALNGVFGIESHLMYLALYEDELAEVYRRQADWNRRFAMNCIDLGVDMIHVSDDWGAQHSLLFSPEAWWKLIYPNHKTVCDAVKGRGAFLSLHSDGNVNAVTDGIAKLGYDVVHPWQESAGMSYADYRTRWQDAFVLMGGLDVQTTIGFGRLDALKADIERVLTLFKDGGLLYCTTPFIQDHCTIDELVFAFDTVRDVLRR